MNAVPLSDTTISGSPWVAKIDRSTSVVTAVVAEETRLTSSHFELASTRTRYMCPRKGPAKSICKRDQGRWGHSHGCSGTGAGE